jgi:glycerophosphoryl diester phosphodiesterase
MKRFFWILLGTLSAALGLVYLWPAPPPTSHAFFQTDSASSVEIIAHGGGLGHAPPNTLFALQRATAMGADMLEADVQQTRDGVLILRHDDTLDRTTNMTGRIVDYDWSELQAADAGVNTKIARESFANRGILIPTLEDALATFPAARWNLEIKNDTAAAAREMCRVILEAKAEDRVLVASFHDSAMSEFRRACPSVATSMSSREVRDFVIAARLGVSRFIQTPAVAIQIPMSAENLDLTHPRIIAAAKARGIVLHYWTINLPEDMTYLISAGADGLITDFVDLGRDAIEG